ncbi:MAG: hypothetical protein IKP67_02945 [Spirochaetales bacterium]|nr:hypothetical protein [Spirochaetales bacterium]
MKKFIAVSYIFAVLLLCGCNTEMRIKEQLNVIAENDTWYCGVEYSINELKNMYAVYVTDSNDKDIYLSYGEYIYDYKSVEIDKEVYRWYFDIDEQWYLQGNHPYKQMLLPTFVLVNDGTEDVYVRLLYTISNSSNGYYYNYGTTLESVQNIHFRKIRKEEIRNISIVADGGIFYKNNLSSLIQNKFNLPLTVVLNSGDKKTISSSSKLWSVTGIDASSDAGSYSIVGHYEDLTTDFCKIRIIEQSP